MHFEFQRANRVCDALNIIAQRVRPVVHWINTPFVAGAMMGCVPDAIEHRITHPDVCGVSLDFCPQRARAIGKFPCFHSRKQIEIFFD